MELMKKPYRKSVVISPHVYPPSVTNAQNNVKGVELFKVLDTTFGYLTKKGYCIGSDCQRFPVAIGEFGSKFTDPRCVDARLQGSGQVLGFSMMHVYWMVFACMSSC